MFRIKNRRKTQRFYYIFILIPNYLYVTEEQYICIDLLDNDDDDYLLHDLRLLDVDKSIYENKKNGFKSNNRIYRKVFNKVSRESKSVDQFGDDYFYSSKEDETTPISITLPKSLLTEVNNYCDKRGITRSRLIRKILVYSLNLKKVD